MLSHVIVMDKRPLYIISARVISTDQRQTMRWYGNAHIVQKYLDKHKDDKRYDQWETEFKNVADDIMWSDNIDETTDSEASY